MNKKLKVIFGFLFFLYFGVYLFSLTFSKQPQTRMHERVIVAIASPVQYAVHFTYEQISESFSHYFFLIHAAKENETLWKQNQELRQQSIHVHELEQENERLRTLMNLPQIPKYEPVYAERIAFGSNEFERTMRINKGAKNNLSVGMPVVNSQGIVGQVVEVFPNYSNVLLLSDKSSAIDVIVDRNHTRGILRGFTPHQLSFEFLSVTEDVQVGDIIISSGQDGIYPTGIPVGVVAAFNKAGRRLFMTATVDPYVSFYRVQEVKVLTRREKQE